MRTRIPRTLFEVALPALPLSRRDVIRNSVLLGTGGALAGMPLAGGLLAQDKPADWPRVKRLVESYVADGKVANMLAVLGKGDAKPVTIAAGSRGLRMAGAVDIDSLYRIYSMTKPITGMATMMCVDAGLLGLDQPLHEILPAFKNLWVQKQYDGSVGAGNLEKLARPITIRHLLTHTAGLGYGFVQQGSIAQAYVDRGLSPYQLTRLRLPIPLLGRPAPSLEAFADRLAEVPLVRQPGTRWSYSVSFDLLGRVIEVVSGKSFESFLQERLFDPLGMTSTYFRVPASETGRLTANYFLLGGMLIAIDMPEDSVFLDKPAFAFGGSGLVSSGRDYDRFLHMLANRGTLNGKRVVSEAAVALATSDLLPETLAANGGPRPGFGFGAGGIVGRGEAEGLFGWAGLAGTLGFVNMRSGLRHTLMTQYMLADAYPLDETFPRLVAQDALGQS